ncbi:hypothetical protein QR680_003861 [Steinernema hermaphroditum]|uniref:Uncharacterized protein n=1 Tax=Steinernema hermaphroditum TaxID=289476 RepID=A0AA39HLU5_9BILA|nr:hypothetical protein QR680_003861 [Steinernema hermaphroditum]
MKTLFVVLLILGFVFVNSAPVVEKVDSGPKNMLLRFDPENRDSETFDTLPDQENNESVTKMDFFTVIVPFG